MFCESCGGLLVPSGEVMLCFSCGKKKGDVTLKSKVKSSQKVEVSTSKKENLPEMEKECESCGHMKVFFWTLQTRAADEPETVFYRCTKCSHTWRDYD